LAWLTGDYAGTPHHRKQERCG